MSTLSPNMNLPISTIGVDSGLNWETNLNAGLSILDSHNHSTGQGVQINPAGININADLVFNNNNGTSFRSVRFRSQTAPLALGTDLGCLYESGVDLYFNDGSGNQIRLTSGGSIVGTAGSISGLPSGTASAAYAAGTFVFQSATLTSATMDVGSIILRNNTASSKGLTLSPPNAMAADYGLTLPSHVAATSFLTLDSSNNIVGSILTVGALTATNLSASANILGSQLSVTAGITGGQIAASTITASNIAAATITGTQIASATISGTNIASATITGANIAASTVGSANLALNHVLTASSGAYASASAGLVNVTNMTIGSITCDGSSPIMLTLTDDTNAGIPGSYVGTSDLSQIVILMDGVTYIAGYFVGSASGGQWYGSIPTTIIIPAAGAHSFQLQVRNLGGAGGSTQIYYCKFSAIVL